MFRIRLDIVNDLNSDSLLQACGATSDNSYVIVRHELPHGNPHYHAYLQMEIQENTLRQRFKRKLKDLKPSDYSIKRCEPTRADEYVQYMFNQKKGNKWELIDSQNYDDVKLKDLQAAARLISDEYSSNKISKRSNGPTMWDMAEEIKQNIDDRMHSYGDGLRAQYPEDGIQQDNQISDYTEAAIFVLRKHRKAHDEYLIRKLISTALSSTEWGKKVFKQKMIKNFSTHY